MRKTQKGSWNVGATNSNHLMEAVERTTFCRNERDTMELIARSSNQSRCQPSRCHCRLVRYLIILRSRATAKGTGAVNGPCVGQGKKWLMTCSTTEMEWSALHSQMEDHEGPFAIVNPNQSGVMRRALRETLTIRSMAYASSLSVAEPRHSRSHHH